MFKLTAPKHVINCVPLMRASPSLACKSIGIISWSLSTSAAGRKHFEVGSNISPSPIIPKAKWASCAKSPLAPTVPFEKDQYSYQTIQIKTKLHEKSNINLKVVGYLSSENICFIVQEIIFNLKIYKYDNFKGYKI